jgi:hypothetical protein
VPNFEIEGYKLWLTQSGTSPSYRSMRLTSVAAAHGIRSRATLFFFDYQTPPTQLGVVHNVDQPNANGIDIYAYLWKVDYRDFYDAVRSEKPLHFDYWYSPSAFDPKQPSRTIVWCVIVSGEEPLGEGPRDEQSAIRFSGVQVAGSDKTPGAGPTPNG